jgi:hypothetical protein
MINTADPDIPLIRKKVSQAIDRAEGQAPPTAKPRNPSSETVTGGSVGSLSDGYAANQSDDLESAC